MAESTSRVVFLCGDVMTGRGIDQILPHGGDPALREAVVRDARDYVRLAEQVNGPISAPADYAWPWGQAVALLDELGPDVRLINLETAITTSDEFAPRKAVHYRMHPDNIGCLTAIRPDGCALANNHVLDFGVRGLVDTLEALSRAGIHAIGAGHTAAQAECPAVVPLAAGGRVLIAGCGIPSSGIPPAWAAGADRAGVALVTDLSDTAADAVADRVTTMTRRGDTTIVSVHWGSNWGYEVGAEQVRFAHRLIDAGVDLVHGHSSHHPRPVEVYRGRLILYGCGDTIDDYEGIGSHDRFRPDLRLLFLAGSTENGALTELRMVPMRMRRLRLEQAPAEDTEWLRDTLERISGPFRTRVREEDGLLAITAA